MTVFNLKMGDNGEIAFDVPILNSEYKVGVIFGKADFARPILRAVGYEEDDMPVSCFLESRGICFHTEDLIPVISLPKRPRTPEQIGTLSHEAVHAINYIWSRIGEKSKDEVYAHSVAAVVRESLEICRQRQTRRTNGSRRQEKTANGEPI